MIIITTRIDMVLIVIVMIMNIIVSIQVHM